MKACTGPTVTTEIPGRQSAPELAPEPLAGLYLKLTKCWRVLFGDALPSGKGSHGLGAWGCPGLSELDPAQDRGFDPQWQSFRLLHVHLEEAEATRGPSPQEHWLPSIQDSRAASWPSGVSERVSPLSRGSQALVTPPA